MANNSEKHMSLSEQREKHLEELYKIENSAKLKITLIESGLMEWDDKERDLHKILIKNGYEELADIIDKYIMNDK